MVNKYFRPGKEYEEHDREEHCEYDSDINREVNLFKKKKRKKSIFD